MGRLILITGGARSGKSSFAERYAQDTGLPVSYIATARVWDGEMEARVAHHRQSRPESWQTIETPDNISKVVPGIRGAAILDCVTMWVTNVMMDAQIDWENPDQAQIGACEAEVERQMNELAGVIAQSDLSFVAVTNELGMGLVPVYAFGRAFRDIAGRANQRLAKAADEVYFVVSGIPMKIK